jgi:hypothetical protein
MYAKMRLFQRTPALPEQNWELHIPVGITAMSNYVAGLIQSQFRMVETHIAYPYRQRIKKPIPNELDGLKTG